MTNLKKYSSRLFYFYIFLCAFEMCLQIKENRDPTLSLSEMRLQLPTKYLVPNALNNNKIVRETNIRINAKSLRNLIDLNDLIDDLVHYDRNRNSHNVIMYPLGTNSRSVDFVVPYERSVETVDLDNTYWSTDWNPKLYEFIGLEDVIEEHYLNDIYTKNKLLDNSFYDLNLNTAGNVSAPATGHDSPLKNDIFLQNVNLNDFDALTMYERSSTHRKLSDREKETEMADVLYKQDVDLGYMLSPLKSLSEFTGTAQANKNEEAEKVEAIKSLKDNLDEILYQQDIDLGYTRILDPTDSTDSTILNDLLSLDEEFNSLSNQKAQGKSENTTKVGADNVTNGWEGIPFKIDNETGEYIRLPLDDLFQGIQPLADNSSNSTCTTLEKFDKNTKLTEGSKNLSEFLDDSTDEISLIMQSLWPSSQIQKNVISTGHENDCRHGICNIIEQEGKSADILCSTKGDAKVQDIANLFAPVSGFYGINSDISSYTHYHGNPNVPLPHHARQHTLHTPHRDEVYFQPHYSHTLDSVGSLCLNPPYANAELHSIKNFQNNPVEVPHSDGFFNSFLNEECMQMMTINGSERTTTCDQESILHIGNTNPASQGESKTIDTNNSLCANNVAERLDLSCDSAVSSLGSERVPSTSDGEWGEGSDSGQDYHQVNYYGPYDYSSGNRNFTTRQMPAVQKKYHMFGKRYFQEQTADNSIMQPAIHFLHSTNSGSECDGMENMIENSSFENCTEGILPTSNVKNTSRLTHPNVKSERDKFENDIARSQINHENLIRHNHTYALLQNSSPNSRFIRENSECKTILPDGHLTRDEKRARNLNLPISVADIINLPMDEFNERISKYDLTENQLSLIRDIRRRGKNKVAAQNCRKRKLDQILSLEGEVKEVRRRKDKLHSDRAFIASEKKRIANKFATLHQHIFTFLRDAEGNPCSPSKYSLQQASDGSIYLLPRDSSKLEPNYHMSILIDASETSCETPCRQRRGQHAYGRSIRVNESPSTTSIPSRVNIGDKNE